MTDTTNTKSQTQRFIEAFAGIREDVTADDKKFALEQLEELSESKISRYLNGYVKDLDTAAALLMIFRGRISEREKVLDS